MKRLLQSSWTASLVGTVVYLVTLTVAWRPLPLASLGNADLKPESTGPSWAFQSTEIDLLIAELKHEKESLNTREKELNELADRLRNERFELQQLTQAVQQIQAEFDRSVTRVRTEETANLKRLAKTYSAMTPEGAATVMKALDDTTVVKVLLFMKEAQAGALLEVLAKQGASDAKRAAAISERLRLSLADSPS